jgi:hypothetical protein
MSTTSAAKRLKPIPFLLFGSRWLQLPDLGPVSIAWIDRLMSPDTVAHMKRE